jgi:hypothetical protein
MSNQTLEEMLGELDAGLFVYKVTEALKMVALGTVQHSKQGQVSMIFDLKQIGDSSSVAVSHTLKYSKPTTNGKMSEENKTVTPMYVNRDGYLTISPELQADLFAVGGNIVTSIKGVK